MHSCNPIWSPRFDFFPKHPITRGVKPFSVKDEWYFNMRFVKNITGNKKDIVDDLHFTPILVGTPDEMVRNGPYVYPRGPYPHICLLYTSPSPRDLSTSRMPSSA